MAILRLWIPFQVLPIRFQLLQWKISNLFTLSVHTRLERGEAPLEFVIRLAQRRLGFDAHFSCQIREREKQIAHLFFDARRVGVGLLRFLAQFRHFLFDLVDDARSSFPVEPDGCGAGAELERAKEGRQCLRHAAQNRLLGRARVAPFACLEVFPFLDHLLRCDRRARIGERYAAGGEDVRMAANQLVNDGLDRIGNGEVAALVCNLREKHRLEQKIAEFFPQRGEILTVERIEQLVGFFQHVRPQRAERLFAIPRTSVWTPQCSHDLDQPAERLRAVIHLVFSRFHFVLSCLHFSCFRASSFVFSCPSYTGVVSDSHERVQVSFVAFIYSLASNAAIHFGDLPDPVTNEVRPMDLDAAEQLIDILAMLEEKTRGNLSAEERQLLDQLLFELRMRFVEVKKSQSPIIQP